MALIKTYGKLWARNLRNIEAIPNEPKGVYVLYDGTMPMYVGKGDIRTRIKSHEKSRRLSQMWDHFSWYIPYDHRDLHDIEALLLRTLPFYLRVLTRESAKFQNAQKVQQIERQADFVNHKMPKRRTGGQPRPAAEPRPAA